MNRRGYFLLLIILIVQLYCWGQYQSEIDWEKLISKEYHFIYPDYFQNQAARIATYTDALAPFLKGDLPSSERLVFPLILYPQAMTSNGYVTPLVHHSLWYTLPFSDGQGSLPWLQLLAIHEGRHVQQLQSLMTSTTGFLYFFAGDPMLTLSMISTPSWFMEGDAVFTETALSDSGRGRQGSFQQNMRILWNKGTPPSYSQLFLPSRKILPVNQYDGGYFFSTWLRTQNGEDFPYQFLSRQAQWPIPLWGTNRALKKITSMSIRKNYQEFSLFLNNYFKPAPTWGNEIQWITSENRHWNLINQMVLIHENPVWIGNTPDKGRSLFIKKDNEIQEIKRSIAPFSRLSANEDFIIWDRQVYMDRYPMNRKTEIVLCNSDMTNKMILFPNERYYSPALSSDGQIALLYQSQQGEFFLITASLDGKIEQKIAIPDALAASWPVWSDKNDKILLVVQKPQGNGLISYDLQKSEWIDQSPLFSRPISRPIWYMGNPAVIMDNPQQKQLLLFKEQNSFKLKDGGYGIQSVECNSRGALYVSSRVSEHGDRLGYLPQPLWLPIDMEELLAVAEGLSFSFSKAPEIESAEIEDFPVEDYGIKWFHPYSWGFITHLSTVPDSVIPFSITSQDPLNSNSWELSYLHDINSNQGDLRLKGQWNYFFTPLQFFIEQSIPSDTVNYNVTRGGALLSLPLGITRGNLHSSLYSQVSLQALTVSSADISQTSLLTEALVRMNRNRSGAFRDIQNRWSYGAESYIAFHPENRSDINLQIKVSGGFSGFWNQRLDGAYYQEINPLGLPSRIPFSRGWDYVPQNQLKKWQLEYQIPLFYPEKELGRILYTSRIRLLGFYNYTEGSAGKTWQSAGVELKTDFYALQLAAELEIGIEYSYLFEEQRWVLNLTLMDIAL